MDEQLRTLIIQELSIETLSEEDANEVFTILGGLILERLVTTLADNLSDEKVVLFEKIITEGDHGKLFVFLAENIDNLDEYVQKCSREVIEEYKQL